MVARKGFRYSNRPENYCGHSLSINIAHLTIIKASRFRFDGAEHGDAPDDGDDDNKKSAAYMVGFLHCHSGKQIL